MTQLEICYVGINPATIVKSAKIFCLMIVNQPTRLTSTTIFLKIAFIDKHNTAVMEDNMSLLKHSALEVFLILTGFK